ncbi:ethanolamine ammonia-lyase reactivating factor EutA [Micromonospora sp. NPDC004704]
MAVLLPPGRRDTGGAGGPAMTGHHHDHHEHDEVTIDHDDHPLRELDQIELTTVGVDIGSATCQVLFSRLLLRRRARDLSSRYEVIGREVRYRSPVTLTPYAEGLLIDERAVRDLFRTWLSDAGLTRGDIDTGAVILTGEATRRRNARALAELFAADSGAFVCATAGHRMEATLAAYGSGAVDRSRRDGSRVLNIDIGGGTTKFAVVDGAAVVATAALHVGGRLAAVDDRLRLTRLEPAGREIARRAGLDWSLGSGVGLDDMRRVGEWMADAVVAVARSGRLPAEVTNLLLTDPLPDSGGYDAVLLSGGVSEYVAGRETRWFGDLGQCLGEALRERATRLPAPLLPVGGGIRATVLGAAQETVQISGSTIYVSDPAVLPLRNLPVVRPPVDLDGGIDPAEVASTIAAHLARLDPGVTDDAAFAFRWHGPPEYRRLAAFVDGLSTALEHAGRAGRPLCLLLDGDIGRTVGAMLCEDRGWPGAVVSIDCVAVTEFEYVDVGSVRPKTGTVPVSVRSLLF